jgi:hypothetical protein
MRSPQTLFFGLFLFGASLCTEEKPKFVGPTDKGFLLPNGWTITPVGKQIIITDLPLNILPLSDNKHVLVATSGFKNTNYH